MKLDLLVSLEWNIQRCYGISRHSGDYRIRNIFLHYNDVIMGAMASQITSLTIVYSAVYSGADQRKHQSSVSLASVRGIHRWPMNSPHKGPVTRKMFPFDDVIMKSCSINDFRYILCWPDDVSQNGQRNLETLRLFIIKIRDTRYISFSWFILKCGHINK